MDDEQEHILEDEKMAKTSDLNPEEYIGSTKHTKSSICVQEISTKVYFVANLKGNILQILDVNVQNKSLMQLEGSKWRPKTRATNKLKLNMKRILNPKLQKEKITVIEDSSSEENNESEENLSPQQNYSQEDHLLSSGLIQGNHEGSEKQVTRIKEQGMTSEDLFVEEEMKDRKEEDSIFKNLNIPWLSNHDSTLHGEVHMDSEVENLRKNLQQHKSQIYFLNETNDKMVMTNRRLREYLEDINAHYQDVIAVSKEALKRKREIQNQDEDLTHQV